MDADDQVQQAEEDEHSNDAEVEMMMGDVDHVFVLEDEQNRRNEARLRSPTTFSSIRDLVIKETTCALRPTYLGSTPSHWWRQEGRAAKTALRLHTDIAFVIIHYN